MSAEIIAAEQRFGQRLRRVRRAAGLTGTELARRAGLPVQAVYRIEGGAVTRRATIGEAVALARVLGVDLAHLLTPDPVRVTVPLGGAR